MAQAALAAPVFAQGNPDPTCPGSGTAPTPTAVPVEAVPIVVASTTADYFVLYVQHDVNGTTVNIPVLVKQGEAGTTTLAENVKALPKERYRVEKYLVADPADVDGDDLNDLCDPNPVNSAALIISLVPPVTNPPPSTTDPPPPVDGALTIPDRDTFEEITYNHRDGKRFLKFFMSDLDTARPRVWFHELQHAHVACCLSHSLSRFRRHWAGGADCRGSHL